MRHYTFVDYATQGYIALVGLLIVFFHNERVPGWPWLIPAHGAGLVLVHGLIVSAARRPQNRVLEFLRHFYPVLLYTAFYNETGLLNEMIVPQYLDAHVAAFEQRWFGFQPSLEFMHRLPYRWASEVFYGAYFSYYIMIVGVGLTLYLRERSQFFHYVSVVSFVFYCCYLMFIFLPVTGPRLFFREVDGYQLPEVWLQLGTEYPFPEAVTQGIFYWIVDTIYAVAEPVGAALPSSHVAVALCTLWFSYRYLPRVRHVHLVAAVLLCLSTVYCRYHYAVDVIAGIAVAAALVPFGNWLYARCGRRGGAATSKAGEPLKAVPQW